MHKTLCKSKHKHFVVYNSWNFDSLTKKCVVHGSTVQIRVDFNPQHCKIYYLNLTIPGALNISKSFNN
jgi:hypothetical protein